MLKTRKTMVSWQAFSSLPPRRPPRVSLAPKTPFLIPLKRLPRRLILQLTAKCSDNWNHSLLIISAHRWFIQFAHFIKSLPCLFEFTDLSVQTRSRSSFSVDLPWTVYGRVCGVTIAGGSEWGGPFVGCRLKFSYFVGSRLKFSIFVGSRLNFLIFAGCPKISVNKLLIINIFYVFHHSY